MTLYPWGDHNLYVIYNESDLSLTKFIALEMAGEMIMSAFQAYLYLKATYLYKVLVVRIMRVIYHLLNS